MTKRLLNLYVDSEIIELAKARQINLSRFFNNVLEIELSVRDLETSNQTEIVISKLKSQNSILASELKNSTEHAEKLNKKILELHNEISIKDDELKLKEDKIKMLNEKVKRTKEENEESYVYSN